MDFIVKDHDLSINPTFSKVWLLLRLWRNQGGLALEIRPSESLYWKSAAGKMFHSGSRS